MTVEIFTVNKLNIRTHDTTDLPLDALTTTDVIALAFSTTDGSVREWLGGQWNLVKSYGNLISAALAKGPTYFSADGVYEYYGEALPGTLITAAYWRVKRVTIGDGQTVWAGGNGNFDNTYDDLATVEGFTFS